MTLLRLARAFGFGLAAAICPTLAAAGCNDSGDPCQIANGTYHILLPDGASGPVPAVMILHGYGADGEGFIRNTGLTSAMLDRGYAVIAPDGQLRQSGQGRSWDFHPDRPTTRDETAFLIAVAGDAATRHGVDRDGILLAGFSIGGSMTTYLACQAPYAFAAYAPVAGSFWRPHPGACAGPVRLFHTHGTADGTVPLTGRAIRPDFVQGNVFEAMQIWRQTNSCTTPAADQITPQGIYTIQRWTDCQPGTDLRFALHDGGHNIPKGWAQMAMDWFETR